MVSYDGFMVGALCFYLSWKERKKYRRKKRIWKGNLNMIEMIKKKKLVGILSNVLIVIEIRGNFMS